MEPPICSVCEKEDFENAEVVYFLETKAVLDEQKRMNERELSYHPSNAAWFCPKHLAAAKALVHLPIDEALSQLKKRKWFNFTKR